MLLLDRRTFDPSRRLHGHRRAVSLATSFCEHNPTLYDMARRANECVVLNATDSSRVVRHHVSSGSTQRHRLYNASLALVYPTPIAHWTTDFGHRTSWRRYSSLPVCSLFGAT